MRRLTLAALAVVAATSASAQTPVEFPRFERIELRGGGSVTLRQGGEQRVTMVRGDSRLTRFHVEDDRLIIDACTRSCRDYDLEIEVIVPSLRAAAIEGGGVIRADRGFSSGAPSLSPSAAAACWISAPSMRVMSRPRCAAVA